MNKTIFATGILFGTLAILLGAFGAHGLKQLVDANAVQTFETGVTYQMYHALFLLLLGSVKQIPTKSKRVVFCLIVLGVVFFSFSIYGLATNTLTSFDFKSIAFITPIGGVLLMSGWILLGYRVFKQFN
ncbi:MAG: DUF423 domain-containing protein [Cellulophaga sp.]